MPHIYGVCCGDLQNNKSGRTHFRFIYDGYNGGYFAKMISAKSGRTHFRFIYWRMQNNCATSDRLKRFVFQRCRLLLVVNVKQKHAQCKYATLYGYETVAR